jgi:hypothetical protein
VKSLLSFSPLFKYSSYCEDESCNTRSPLLNFHLLIEYVWLTYRNQAQ